MRTLTLVCSLFVLMLSSCSKTNVASDTRSKHIGKWELKTFTAKDFLGSQPRTTTGNYKPGEYIQIESDGTCYFKVDNAITKTTWKLLDDEKPFFFRSLEHLICSKPVIRSLISTTMICSSMQRMAQAKARLKSLFIWRNNSL